MTTYHIGWNKKLASRHISQNVFCLSTGRAYIFHFQIVSIIDSTMIIPSPFINRLSRKVFYFFPSFSPPHFLWALKSRDQVERLTFPFHHTLIMASSYLNNYCKQHDGGKVKQSLSDLSSAHKDPDQDRLFHSLAFKRIVSGSQALAPDDNMSRTEQIFEVKRRANVLNSSSWSDKYSLEKMCFSL